VITQPATRPVTQPVTQPARGYPATAPSHVYAAAPSQAGPSHAKGAPQSNTVAVQIGSFFRDLRRNFKISQPEIASRLSTRIEIIAALEAGDVRNLPPWPETCRIVQTYTSLAGLDPRPVLRLIEMMQMRMGRQPAVAHTYEDEAGIFSRAASGMKRGWSGGIGRGLRVLVALSIPVALILLVTQTSVLEAAVARLPPPVKRLVRGAQNYVIVQLAPVRDGLRWIDVPDPRSRRGDKLPTPASSD
jgi:transcriptional regulator with XRE-family HTH domain